MTNIYLVKFPSLAGPDGADGYESWIFNREQEPFSSSWPAVCRAAVTILPALDVHGSPGVWTQLRSLLLTPRVPWEIPPAGRAHWPIQAPVTHRAG